MWKGVTIEQWEKGKWSYECLRIREVIPLIWLGNIFVSITVRYDFSLLIKPHYNP